MAGYNQRRMSNNAAAAYAKGEKPWGKWSKGAILEHVEKSDPTMLPTLRKWKVSALKRHLLVKTSWHHTGHAYTKTDFYSFNSAALLEIKHEF